MDIALTLGAAVAFGVSVMLVFWWALGPRS